MVFVINYIFTLETQVRNAGWVFRSKRGDSYGLSVLITKYTQACVDQQNIDTFSALAKDFYYSTISDGYEAYYALRELFESDPDKRKIIDFLIAEEEKVEEYPFRIRRISTVRH